MSKYVKMLESVQKLYLVDSNPRLNRLDELFLARERARTYPKINFLNRFLVC